MLVTKIVRTAAAAGLGLGLMTAGAAAQGTLEKIKEEGVIVAGQSGSYPPFEFVADGELVGFDIDMGTEIARRMGVEIEWQTIDFKGIIAALQSGRTDVLITAMTKTPERAERILFSDPYYDAGTGAIVPVDSDIERPEDLAGRTIGVQLGSSGERYVRDELEDIVGSIQTYDDIVLAINDLKNGRVEAVVNPLPVLMWNIKGDPDYRATEVWLSRSVGINARMEDEDLMAEINAILADLEEEGFLAELEAKWFGDGTS